MRQPRDKVARTRRECVAADRDGHALGTRSRTTSFSLSTPTGLPSESRTGTPVTREKAGSASESGVKGVNEISSCEEYELTGV